MWQFVAAKVGDFIVCSYNYVSWQSYLCPRILKSWNPKRVYFLVVKQTAYLQMELKIKHNQKMSLFSNYFVLDWPWNWCKVRHHNNDLIYFFLYHLISSGFLKTLYLILITLTISTPTYNPSTRDISLSKYWLSASNWNRFRTAWTWISALILESER